MMQYNFYILTTEGLKNSIVDTTSDFEYAPFGFVSYRQLSSCKCGPNVIEDFWNCVDIVLKNNNLTSTDFVRAVRAYSDGKLYGEYECQ